MSSPKRYQEARYWTLRAQAYRAEANAAAANPYMAAQLASTFAAHYLALAVLADREADSRNQPRPKGRSFQESDVEHVAQPVSCFDRAPYRHSRPQADTRDSQAFRISVSESSQR